MKLEEIIRYYIKGKYDAITGVQFVDAIYIGNVNMVSTNNLQLIRQTLNELEPVLGEVGNFSEIKEFFGDN